MEKEELSPLAPAIQQFLMAIADAGGIWRGYTADDDTAEMRDWAELHHYIEVSPAGGGFDYAEQYTLLPKGYGVIGRPAPLMHRSMTERLRAHIRSLLGKPAV